MLRIALFSAAAMFAANAAAQEQSMEPGAPIVERPAPGTHSPGSLYPRARYFDLAGDYGGRQMRLEVGGVLAFEGAREQGAPIRIDIPEGEGFISIVLDIEPCEQQYRSQIMPDAPPTLLIDGCLIAFMD